MAVEEQRPLKEARKCFGNRNKAQRAASCGMSARRLPLRQLRVRTAAHFLA